MLRFTLLFLGFFIMQSVSSQKWVEMMQDRSVNFYEVQAQFEKEWGDKPYERGKGFKQYKRWEAFMEPRVFPHGNRINLSATYEAAKAADVQGLTAGITADSSDWKPLGPYEWITTSYNPGLGRVNAIEEHPVDSLILFAGTPSGGLWKSTDGGQSWNPKTDFMATLGVSDIVINPNNPDSMYMATGDDDGSDNYSIGVLLSVDGGDTWTETGLTHNTRNNIVCSRLLMNPNDSRELLVATSDGVFKSIDAGNSWTLSMTGRIRDLEYMPGNPEVVYASTSSFFRSDNGGESFNRIDLPDASDISRLELGVSPADSTFVYALAGRRSNGGYRGLWLSTDGGQEFNLQSETPNILTYDSEGSGEGGQAWYDLAIAVDPNNADDVFTGGINVWRSQNRGVDFFATTAWVYPAELGYVHADIHTLEFFGDNLYCGSDGGVFISTDLAGTWREIDFGMQIMQMYKMSSSLTDDRLMTFGSQDNGSYKYDGENWTHIRGADGMETIIDYSNDDRIFTASQFGGILYSRNGGLSFQNIHPNYEGGGNWITPYIQDVVNPDVIYVGTDVIYKINVEEQTLETVPSSVGGTLDILIQAEANEDVLYAATDNRLSKSVDGATSFSRIASPSSGFVTYLETHPDNENIVYATVSRYNGKSFMVSRDGGDSWENYYNGLPNVPANCIAYQKGSPDGIFVGTDIGVYYRDSTMNEWIPYMKNLPNVIVNELDINYDSKTVRAATYGRGLWESPYVDYESEGLQSAFSQKTTNCDAPEVQFFNESVNEQKIEWVFESGEPERTNVPNPYVTYETFGTYNVTMITSTGNSSDTIVEQVIVKPKEFEVGLLFYTDDFPQETSWELYDNEGELVSSQDGYLDGETAYDEIFCSDTTCYTLVVYDEGNNGMCCGNGDGFYSVYINNGVYTTGGEFESSDTVKICLGGITSTSEEKLNGVSLYPNPTSSEATLSLPAHDSYIVGIFDASGRLVKRKEINSETYRLTTDELPKGVYNIKVSSSEGRTTTLPLIKQ